MCWKASLKKCSSNSSFNLTNRKKLATVNKSMYFIDSATGSLEDYFLFYCIKLTPSMYSIILDMPKIGLTTEKNVACRLCSYS